MKITLVHVNAEKTEVTFLLEGDEGTAQVTATPADILAIKKRQGTRKNRQSKSAGRKFSRIVSMVRRVARTGRWSNGAEYPIETATAKLCATYWQLQPFERADVTSNALVSLRDIFAITQNGAIADLITDLLKHKGAK